MKRVLIWLSLFVCSTTAWALDPPEMRAMYCATFDINTQAKCDTIIARVLAANINAVYIEVRGRADAYYYPNREDSTYPNNEPRGELYAISPSDLDTLQYFIDRLHNATPRREVHAWCTTFNSWNRSTAPVSPNHVYNAHPEWITENDAGVTATYSSDAPLDPGIPAVQDHIYNVFMDIVRNYDIDGIHFDYIRLHSSNAGYDSVARAQFQAETGFTYNPASPGALSEVYKAWRRDQIAQLVQRVHDQTALEKPWVDVAAFLVNFFGTDSIDFLGQGYNWWVAHDAIDVLHPGCYSSTVAGTESDWNHYIGRLAENGDQNKIPVVCAVGSYLFVDDTGANGGADDPARNTSSVTTVRANSRVPDGFNFYDYGALYSDGTPTYAADILAQNLFNAGGPMDDWADMPASFLKTGEETTPPNAPASLATSLVGGKPRVTFNRPAAAGDGDLPVHYRLYRHTASPVTLYYSNMVMEWWDLDSTRASFTFDDVEAPAGTYYYAAVAYDEWNNAAVATSGAVAATSTEYIIETCATMLHSSDFSVTAGAFFNSSSHSTAPGCTNPAPNPASRFATPGSDGSSRGDKGRFTPSALATGTYDVYVTTYNFASANAQNITVRLNQTGGVPPSLFNLTQATCGNVWTKVATMNFVAGSGHYIEFDNTTQTNWGDGTNDRMVPCAVRFVSASGTPVAKEPKPAVTPATSSVAEVIVDSEPTALDYDDAGSWGSTSYAPSGLPPYEGSTRFYNNATSLNSYAVFVVDLPQSGNWAIDGYVRTTQGGLAQHVQYRFVDGTGTARSTVATLQTGTGGWTVNVDEVADNAAYFFNKGRVYVTIYGNSGFDQQLQADALRFRLIYSEVADWLYF